MSRQIFSANMTITIGKKTIPMEADPSGEKTFLEFLSTIKSTLITTAAETLSWAKSRGFDPNPITLVDGVEKDPSQVHPLGRIEFLSSINSHDLVVQTFIEILKRSKVVSGRYKENHIVTYNGRGIANDLAELEAWALANPSVNPGDVFRIVNLVPYARRLELLGVTAQRTRPKKDRARSRRTKRLGYQVSVPAGAYQLAYRSMKSRFGKRAFIGFSFVPGNKIGVAGGGTLPGEFKTGAKGQRGRSYLYPSITISIGERGISNV